VIGAAGGYLSLWLVYWAFKLTTGKEGMGYGDFKLLAALGAWLGWQMLPLTILLSSMLGAVVGITLIVVHQTRAKCTDSLRPLSGCGRDTGPVLGKTPDARLHRFAVVPSGCARPASKPELPPVRV
jgi:hypothetical protein